MVGAVTQATLYRGSTHGFILGADHWVWIILTLLLLLLLFGGVNPSGFSGHRTVLQKVRQGLGTLLRPGTLHIHPLRLLIGPNVFGSNIEC